MRTYKKSEEDIAIYSRVYGTTESVADSHLKSIYDSCSNEDEHQGKLVQVLWCGNNELCRPVT